MADDNLVADSLDEPAVTGGRIVTQNPALMSMLKENTMDKPVRRVYVESPVFSEADDDKYKYISADVDEFDEGQERALKDSATARRTPQYNYKDNIAYKQRQASRESSRHTDTGMHDAQRYEDRNLRSNGYSADKQDLVPETQYVVKKQGSRYGSGLSKVSDRSQHRFIQPIDSPHRSKHPVEDEDDYELQREASYQEKLQAKIRQQAAESDQITIPKLDLIDSDDERPQRSKESMDLMLEGKGNQQRDSLDEPDAQGFRDSLDQHPSYRNQDPETGVNNMQPRPSYASLNSVESSTQQQNQLLHQQNLLQQQQLQMLQQQMLQAQQQGQLIQQPMMMQPQVMMLPNGQMVYQQPQVMPQQPFMLQQPVMMASQEQVDYGHQEAHPADYSQAIEPDQVQPEEPQYDEDAYLEQYEMEMQQNQEEQPVDENGELEYPEVKDRGIIRPVPMEKAPSVDYVEKNKKQLKKEQQQSSYGAKFRKKKTSGDDETPPVPAPRKTVPGKPPAAPAKASSAGPVMEEAQGENLTPAEQVWAARAKTLTQQKSEKVAVRQGKPGSKAPLKKYPSESKVNDMRRPAGVPQGFRPHHVHPMAPPPVQGSMAEPIRSEMVVDPHRTPDHPIRHTVLTEDGQKVSVDINLKLVSPPPPNRVIPPLGPQNQQFQQAIQQPPQRPIHAFQDHYEPHPILSNGSPQGYPIKGNTYRSKVTFAGDDYPIHADVYQKSPTPVQSPYRILPPIGSADTDQGRPEQVQYNGGTQRRAPAPQQPHGSPRAENAGSYLEQLHKQKKKPEYKSYTINDYRKMKKEVRLGGLGPDIDSETLRERKEKLARQQEYARQANERNKQQPKRAPPREPEPDPDQEDMLHRRKVALEYAKSVPKPKAQKSKPTSGPGTSSAPSRGSPAKPSSRLSNQSQPMRAVHVVSAGTERELELIDLQKLQERHDRERQQVALIKSNMEQTA